MDSSAQNNNQQNANPGMDVNQTPVNPPMPPLPETPVTPPSAGSDTASQPVFMGPLEDNVTQPQAPVVNDIPSLSNTPTSNYGSSGGGARRIATALFGILMLAIIGVGGYFGQQLLLNPKDVTLPFAQQLPCIDNQVRAPDGSCVDPNPAPPPANECLYYNRYICRQPGNDYAKGCPPVKGGDAFVEPNLSSDPGAPGDNNWCAWQVDCWTGTESRRTGGGIKTTPECTVPADQPAPPAPATAIPGCTDNYCFTGRPWANTCCNSLSEGAHCQHTWDEGFYAACHPTPPPATQTPITMQCASIKAYDDQWNLLTPTQLSTLTVGDVVRFTAMGTTTGGTIDRARFAVNGAAPVESAAVKPGTTNEYYYEYTIPAGVTSFTVAGEVHHATLGWK